MSRSDKKKILILVEGAKTDVSVMKKLFCIYDIDAKYKIVSYCTNIYTLYQEMFRDDIDEMDILQVLKSIIRWLSPFTTYVLFLIQII